ncbi:transmembrane protein 265-like [Acipenser oxyrinchus oxyrinchus]|uniref:Transmembrane protein 265-like n=1 Tax=Acipenser oxyrinchus oxyrinchus TaxID=40147 RepID=A0AAD8CJM8_ACIOX|nr:transmembrane protein 265-like [Acipenser oxyrinchus oxyrinchus]
MELTNGQVCNGSEATPLAMTPGSVEGSVARPRPPHKEYRTLSIASVICGISCIGVLAVISSVKASERRRYDPEQADLFASKARRFSVLSITVFVGLLVLVPLLMALVSYLLTIVD